MKYCKTLAWNSKFSLEQTRRLESKLPRAVGDSLTSMMHLVGFPVWRHSIFCNSEVIEMKFEISSMDIYTSVNAVIKFSTYRQSFNIVKRPRVVNNWNWTPHLDLWGVMAAKILFRVLLCRTCPVYKFFAEKTKLNKDRAEITQAERNLKHGKLNTM